MTRLFWIALLYALPAAAQDAPSVPHFVDETAASGLQSTYVGQWQYMVGGGVSTFDCNGDALPEMVLAGGESGASLWLNRSVAAGGLRFEQAGRGWSRPV